MNLLNQHYHFIQRQGNNESINAKIVQELRKNSKDNFFPDNYFFSLAVSVLLNRLSISGQSNNCLLSLLND